MKDGYEISLYRHDYNYQVVKLLNYLWHGDTDVNLSYFKWKYVDNPYTENPLGIVAFHKGKIVGYRGYSATKWQIREKDYKIIVLFPEDTCVHPDHRRKGLSVAMGEMAKNEYSSKYKIFLNCTAAENSVPGYLKMGFYPLVDKAYLTRYNILGLIKRYISIVKKKSELCKSNIKFGQFDDIIVADRPRPKEMSTVIHTQGCDDHRLTLLEDEEFFQWRFSSLNKRSRKHIFYYFRKNNVTTGYIAMYVSQNNRGGTIIDYAQNDGIALEKILLYVIKMKHYESISIYNFSPEENFLRTLRRLRFKINSLSQIVDAHGLKSVVLNVLQKERKVERVWSLLVRPVKRECTEDDWFLEGLDVRKSKNWAIKEICSC